MTGPSSASNSPQTVIDLKARQVLDSRGNPTVEVDVFTAGGKMGRAIVPSGASTGVHEALELRDGNKKIYGGKSVSNAVRNVNTIIKPKILGRNCTDQRSLDRLMIELDGTPNKSRLGANAILAVSMTLSRAGALSEEKPLFMYLDERNKYLLPVPMMNVINGGMHAGNKLAVQEFLIEPVGAGSYHEALQWGAEVYHSLKDVLKEKYGVSAINVGDEGGYAPPLENTLDALDSIMTAMQRSGHAEDEVKLGLDAASSSFFSESKYRIDEKVFSSDELQDFYLDLISTYPILTLEDPFAEEEFEAFASFTSKVGDKIKVIGDDLYVTNTSRISLGIAKKATNAVLIKLNQIGSVSETLDAINLANNAGLSTVVSHRSGETEDTFISHLATAVESPFIKAGAPARGERTAKYNELLRIEELLGPERALFAGTTIIG